MQTNYNELKKVLDQAIADECIERRIDAPNIKEEEWFAALDVLEAHYLANNMMDKYLEFVYWYVRVVTNYADGCNDLANLFGDVYISSGRLDNIENVKRFEEGEAFREEVTEKLKQLHQKGAKIKK